MLGSRCSTCKSHLTTLHPVNLPSRLGREDPVVLENQSVFLISSFFLIISPTDLQGQPMYHIKLIFLHNEANVLISI